MLLIVITKHLYFLHNMFYCNVSLHSLILLLSGRGFRDNHYEAFMCMYMYIKAIFSARFILPDSSLCLKLQNMHREFEVGLIPIIVIHQSIHPSIHPSIYPFVHQSIHPLSIHTLLHSSIDPSFHTFHHSFIHSLNHLFIASILSFYLSIYQSIHPSIHPPIHPSIHSYIHQSIHHYPSIDSFIH